MDGLKTPSKQVADLEHQSALGKLQESPVRSVYSGISFDQNEHRISYEEAIEQIIALTNELRDFEKSSKELEEAMELELDDLNQEKASLLRDLASRNDELSESKQRMIGMEKELIALTDQNTSLVKSLELKLSHKSKALIDVEIQNDNFESTQRIIKNKLEMQEEQYNEMLERNVLLQEEVSELTRLYNGEKLANSNHVNTVHELNARISQLELENERLRIRNSKPEKLSKYKTPAIPSPGTVAAAQNDVHNGFSQCTHHVPRSSSIHQIQEMNAMTNQLSKKADTLRQRLEDLDPQQSDYKKRGGKLARFRSRSESTHGKENKVPNRSTSEGSGSRLLDQSDMDLETNSPSNQTLSRAKSQKSSNTNRLLMAFKRM